MTTTVPKIYSVDVNAINKVFDGSTEILAVALKGGSALNYFSIIDDLGSIMLNIKEAKAEVKEGLNPLEIDILIKDNVAESCKKFNVLQGKSKYGTETIMFAVSNIAQVVSAIKTALDDGAQVEDLKHLPEIFILLTPIYTVREKLILEAKDIQAQELEDILSGLYGYIIWILND